MNYSIKKLVRFVFLMLSVLASEQSTAQSYILKGTVVDSDSSFTIPNSYVVNSKTFAGTITNGIGYFELSVAQGDTLIFSNVG
ncbi:MAG TPA: hypothetical protein DCM15_02790, partial [Cryomorphaceae bacterium]|nr:hypothetical protein [Cryomorphaceae bacterium]